jgi:hypothetical protein
MFVKKPGAVGRRRSSKSVLNDKSLQVDPTVLAALGSRAQYRQPVAHFNTIQAT